MRLNVKPVEQEQLKALIDNFVDVFETKNSPRGFYDKVQHRIDTSNNPPVQQMIRERVNKTLHGGIILNQRRHFSVQL